MKQQAVRARAWVGSSLVGLFLFISVGVVLGALALAAGDSVTDRDPGAACDEPGIVALEFAGDREAAARVVDGWSCPAESGSQGQTTSEAQDLAGDSLRWDNRYFIPLYVAAIAWWCLYGAWFAQRPKVRRLGWSLMIAIVVAGLLDLIENAAMWDAIVHPDGTGAVRAAAVTLPKWAVVVVALAYAVFNLAGAVVRWTRRAIGGDREAPEFLGPQTEDEGELERPSTPASDAEERRNARLRRPDGGPWPEDTVGICLSGGGIRAAAFALGALQGLQQERWPRNDGVSIYERADYLATVSGGGYTGTAAQTLAHRHPQTLPLEEGSPEAAEIRRRRRYLWGPPTAGSWVSSTRDFVTGLLSMLSGTFVNAFLLTALLVVVAVPLGWFAGGTIHADQGAPGLGDIPTGQWLGWALVGVAVAVLLWPFLTSVRLGRGLPPQAVLAVGKAAILTIALTVVTSVEFPGPWTWLAVPVAAALLRVLAGWLFRRLGPAETQVVDEVRRPIWAAALGWVKRLLVVGLAWALSALAATGVWFFTQWGVENRPDDELTWLPLAVVIGILVFAAVAVVVGAGLRKPVDWLRRRGRPRTFLWAGIVVAVAFGVVAGVVSGKSVARGLEDSSASVDAVIMTIAASLGLVYLALDQKWWSPHPLYKARLARTFALTRDARGGVRQLPFRIRTLLSRWATKPQNGPQLLICGAAYETTEPRSQGEPDAVRFVFSNTHSGGPDIGWARTVDFEAALGRSNATDGTLQAAMAISGAAVSPAIGTTDLGAANALMAAANLRLGVWLPSPGYIRALREPGYPASPSWVRIRRFTYLLKEMISLYDPNDRFVYVTDGGQLDNLGLYELLSRQARHIFCFDASGDLKPGRALNTNTFDGVRELARRRLGVRFSLPNGDPDGGLPGDSLGEPVTPGMLTAQICADVQPDWGGELPRVRIAADQVAMLDIHYPDGTRGTLYFAKCVLTPDVDQSVRRYAMSEAGRRRFPADTTVDQWLDEDQFDAYVALGHQAAATAAARAHE